MPVRAGPDNHRSGPHLLPTGKPKYRTDRSIADPANGARVPRCRCCGMPGPIDIVGVRAGVPGRLPICDACWFTANPPDPLDVSEIA